MNRWTIDCFSRLHLISRKEMKKIRNRWKLWIIWSRCQRHLKRCIPYSTSFCTVGHSRSLTKLSHTFCSDGFWDTCPYRPFQTLLQCYQSMPLSPEMTNKTSIKLNANPLVVKTKRMNILKSLSVKFGTNIICAKLSELLNYGSFVCL